MHNANKIMTIAAYLLILAGAIYILVRQIHRIMTTDSSLTSVDRGLLRESQESLLD